MKNVTYINAGAGSGKTYRLTETLTNLIKGGKVKPEEVILTTFTIKAANEFKEKAKAALIDEGMYDEASRLDHAMIGTIHSVCQRLVSKYWFHLGLAPDMGVMTDDDATYYTSQSLAELPTEEELKMLHHIAKDFGMGTYNDYGSMTSIIDYNFWQDHLKKIIGLATNYEIENFDTSKNESLNFIRQFVDKKYKCIFTETELIGVLDEHEAFLRTRKPSAANDARITKLVDARRDTHAPWLSTLKNIHSTIGTPQNWGELADNFKEQMDGLWLSQLIYEKEEPYIELLFELAKRWKNQYAQFKREKNLLDFNDMEKYMRKLLQNSDVAKEISLSYHYLFVDEFQDSSPIQVKIFDELSDLMTHSYWVGDYKQAIYGFRGSDIALVKSVVDRIATKENGCELDALKTSWRSLPDIVSVNNAIFNSTFASVLDKESIQLKSHRENTDKEVSLRYFVSTTDEVAEHVMKLLKNGAKPSDIAVLARFNSTLSTISTALKVLKIPSSRADLAITDSSIFGLVASLLRIVDHSSDAMARTQVAILTQPGYTAETIIEAKILNDSKENSNPDDFLDDIPLIQQLMTLRPQLKQQSVAALVECMIIELNLYDVAKELESDTIFSDSCLDTIISTAHNYEEHCIQMNLPATIDGFIAYISDLAPTGSGNPDGVQLYTYHGSKGLQWKYVILTSLDNGITDQNKAMKREIFGVHAIHASEPSVKTPYPETYIRLTPWIYATARKIPNEITRIIASLPAFDSAYNAMLAENNRLFYVGMTRPRDVLLLHINNESQSYLQWPKDIGIGTINDKIPTDNWNIFGTEHEFHKFTISDEERAALGTYGLDDATDRMQLNIPAPTFQKREPRFLSPSKLKAKGDIINFHEFGQRIPFAEQAENMAQVGNCIHQIYAGIESRTDQSIAIDQIIASHGLTDILQDTDPIVTAWNNLVQYLTETDGKSIATYHERPFRLERDGQLIVGSIDLVWQTNKGDILIDFKTCPKGTEEILNVESEFYAGKYAAQLDSYTAALEAAGEKVHKRYIYYPVSGLLVEIAEASK